MLEFVGRKGKRRMERGVKEVSVITMTFKCTWMSERTKHIRVNNETADSTDSSILFCDIKTEKNEMK